MHEELFGDDEGDVRPRHPLISQAPVPEFPPPSAQRLDPYDPPSVITRTLANACAGMAQAVFADGPGCPASAAWERSWPPCGGGRTEPSAAKPGRDSAAR